MDNISIITPVYNDPRLEKCIESITSQQEAPPTQLIVVDGKSTDETVDVIESYRDQIDILIREPDDGIYDAMNKGLNKSDGDIVGILNADDRYNDNYVLADVSDKITETGADGCYGDLVYVGENDRVIRYWKSGPCTQRRMYFGWMPPHPTLFIRNDIYDQVGAFDTSYRVAADYEFILRLLFVHNVELAYVDRVLVRMATGGQSNKSIKNIITSNVEAYLSWRRNNIRGGYLVPFLKPARKIPQFLKTP